MPRPKKRSGKNAQIREERREARNDQERQNAKRRKLDNGSAAEVDEEVTGIEVDQTQGTDALYFEDTTPGLGVTDETPTANKDEIVYYGLLDDEEQAYYANVNTKIVSNDFEDDEEKLSFIEAVYRESRGKEMKLASSQSCSRYLERIIKVSNADQLRGFFQAILEGLTQLIQHRFGSHVCETLFAECAKHVRHDEKDSGNSDELSITALFLQASEELQQNIGFMLTDKFASHTVRVLLLVLSGEPLQDPSTKTLLASKKKEHLEGPAATQNEEPAKSRKVPKSFLTAMTALTTAAVSSLDATYLRALATHPTGNPVLQLLLRLELVHSDRGKSLGEKSLFYRLVEPDSLAAESEGAKFVSGLTYDSTGSRLIEVLVVYAPGKVFKKLYKGIWKEKMQSMAKNDIANFVAIKILERLGKDELQEARDAILPDLSLLLDRRRFSLLKTLVDRSVVRELDFKSMLQAFNGLDGKRDLLDRLLYPETDGRVGKDEAAIKADVHGSLLAQTMLEAGSISEVIYQALSQLQSERLVELACDPAASRVVQLSLTAPTATLGYRKLTIPKFYGQLLTLATNPVGSFLVDALWQATAGLHFMKERLAGEIAAHQTELRDSHSGRKVWRNWSMDTYMRSRGQWQARAKGLVAAAAADADDSVPSGEVKKKTPIELARQRRAEEKAKQQQQQQQQHATVSANA